ncbi:MAG: hypothetical protein HY094_07810 [Candidatus Melainabacteria bacterium]|nr:hypothetical protein [Candidatus Melainabacteria bacterium]
MNFISFSILLFIFLIAISNISNAITIETVFLSLKVNVGFLILMCSVLTSFAMVLFNISASSSVALDKNNLKKQIENQKLKHELESDKVKQLEAKIYTLEEALKMVTKK